MQPVLFLSHGGGPRPLLADPSHDAMNAVMFDIKTKLTSRPDAIVIISAHWEGDGFGVYNHAEPGMLYDYRNFPDEAYQLRYPAPGSEAVSTKILESLKSHKLPFWQEQIRGYDHGVFVPMMLLYPEADIPIIPISLDQNLDPAQHIKLGTALAGLREQNILIISSGFQFHNLSMFYSEDTQTTEKTSMGFTEWLDSTLSDETLSEAERSERLTRWIDAPFAKLAHPREEHLLPLHAAYGAAQKPVTEIFKFNINSVVSRCYWWD